MPEDLAFPFTFNDDGDADSVDGDSFYYQHAQLLGLIAAYDQRGDAMTANDILSFEDELGSIFANSPYFDPPIQVNVTSVDESRLDIEMTASNIGTYEITV